MGAGQLEQRRTEMGMFLVIGRAVQSPGSMRSTSEAGEEPAGRAQNVTLICRQHWSQSPGVADGHTWCVGSKKGQAVTIGRWYELDMEGEADRASNWGRVDAGRPRAGERSAKGQGRWWALGKGDPVADTHKATEPQRWTFAFSFGSQSLSLES